jgi:O-antigen/teichoic acid export membrane protein
VILALSIVPTSIAGIALPRLVARIRNPGPFRSFVRRVGGGIIVLALVLAATTALVARPAVDFLFPSYQGAVPILLLLLAAVPFRGISTFSGVVLVASDRVSITVWTNLLALGVTMLAWFAGASRWGVSGAAGAVVAGEVVSAGAYAMAAWHSLPTVSREPSPAKGPPNV